MGSGKRRSIWFLLYSGLLWGWVFALTIEMTRLITPQIPVWGMAAYLGGLGLGLGLAALMARWTWWVLHETGFRNLSLALWMAAMTLTERVSSPLVWAIVMVLTLSPALAGWALQLADEENPHRYYALGWCATATVTFGLLLLAGRFPDHARWIFDIGGIPLQLAVWLAPKASFPSTTPRARGDFGSWAVALALFLVFGLAKSLISLGTVDSWGITGLMAVLFTTLSLCVSVVLVRRLPYRMYWLAYLSSLAFCLALLHRSLATTPTALVWSQLTIVCGASLLAVWWSATVLRSAPRHILWGGALGTAGVALGSLIPVVAGLQSDRVIFWGVTLVLAVMPAARGEIERRTPPTKPTPDAPPPDDLSKTPLWQDHLTPQEQRIVLLILKGYSNAQIAQELYISTNTLKTHLRNIYRKTGTQGKQSLSERYRMAESRLSEK